LEHGQTLFQARNPVFFIHAQGRYLHQVVHGSEEGKPEIRLIIARRCSLIAQISKLNPGNAAFATKLKPLS
jgi:hypothetical protein